MNSDYEEEKEATKQPKFPIQMFISEGNQYLRLGKYDLALEFFNKGLDKELANEKCLIGRSKCNMRLARYAEAKEDAEAVFKAYPKSPDAKMLIGEADYFLGDFERAFLTFHRGHSSRLNHDGLRCGHQMCTKAIDNALKPDVPIVIDKEDVQNVQKLKEDCDAERNVQKKVVQGQFSKDIDFVNSILKDDTEASVHLDCEYVRDYLRDRQIFWRAQNPDSSKGSKTDSIAKSDMKGRAKNDDSHMSESDKVDEADVSASEPRNEK